MSYSNKIYFCYDNSWSVRYANGYDGVAATVVAAAAAAEEVWDLLLPIHT